MINLRQFKDRGGKNGGGYGEGKTHDNKILKTKAGTEKRTELNSNSEAQLFDIANSSIRWLTTKETAEYLRTSPKQIRNWVYEGKVKAYKLLGRSLRFKSNELDLLLKGDREWQ